MKTAMLFTGTGPILIVTRFESLTDPRLTGRLVAKGAQKLLCIELPLETVRERYGNHFDVVCENLHETDDLRVVDYDGHRILSLFSVNEYGPLIIREFLTEPSAGVNSANARS
jgi:hypothetical protein